MHCCMPGLPVHHQLPELAQTHVHRVGDAIQPSHPLLSPSPPAFNLSQHQDLFQWVNSSLEVAKVLTRDKIQDPCMLRVLTTRPPERKKEKWSRSVVSDSLWPHESQHARPPCPSPTPRAHPNSCPLSRWCHPTISSSVVPFSSCLQSFPASGSFQMSQFFPSGGQSIGVSASASACHYSVTPISFRLSLRFLSAQSRPI